MAESANKVGEIGWVKVAWGGGLAQTLSEATGVTYIVLVIPVRAISGTIEIIKGQLSCLFPSVKYLGVLNTGG